MIYIVRHGQTDWNTEGKYQGQTDIELNLEGVIQAEILRKELKDIDFDIVFSSPLKRAYKTAQIIYQGNIITDNRLMERFNGDLEGKYKKHHIVDFNDPNETRFNIEPITAFRKRIVDFWDYVIKNHSIKNVLIVTHGGVGIYSQCYFKGEPQNNDYNQYMMKNCDIIQIETTTNGSYCKNRRLSRNRYKKI